MYCNILVRDNNFFEFFARFFDDNLLEKNLFSVLLGEAASDETFEQIHLLVLYSIPEYHLDTCFTHRPLCRDSLVYRIPSDTQANEPFSN